MMKSLILYSTLRGASTITVHLFEDGRMQKITEDHNLGQIDHRDLTPTETYQFISQESRLDVIRKELEDIYTILYQHPDMVFTQQHFSDMGLEIDTDLTARELCQRKEFNESVHQDDNRHRIKQMIEHLLSAE